MGFLVSEVSDGKMENSEKMESLKDLLFGCWNLVQRFVWISCTFLPNYSFIFQISNSLLKKIIDKSTKFSESVPSLEKVKTFSSNFNISEI